MCACLSFLQFVLIEIIFIVSIAIQSKANYIMYKLEKIKRSSE